MARNIPEYLRRSIRLAIATGIACAVGFSLLRPLGGWHSKWGSQTMMGTKWAAITCVVINHPVISKTGEAAVERVLGTVAGGVLGYLLAIFIDAQFVIPTPFITVPSVAGIGFLSVLLGAKLQLDYAGRLFIMTFILVAMAAPTQEVAFIVAVTRISGIIFGVIMTMILSVIVFPKSASHQATDNLKAGLSALAELNSIVWKERDCDKTNVMEPLKYQRPGGIETPHIHVVIEPEDKSVHLGKNTLDDCCDGVLTEVYSRMSKCQEFASMSKSETYVYTNRGRWCFCPAFKCFPWRSALPIKEMYQVTESARKVARLLWCLHASLPDEDDIRALGHFWGAHEFLESLGASLQIYLENVAACFPGQHVLASEEMYTFIEGVETLITASHRATNDSTVLLQASYGHRRPSQQGFAYESDEDEELFKIDEEPEKEHQITRQNNVKANGESHLPPNVPQCLQNGLSSHGNRIIVGPSAFTNGDSKDFENSDLQENSNLDGSSDILSDIQSVEKDSKIRPIRELRRKSSIAGTLSSAHSLPLETLSGHNVAYIVEKDSVMRVGGPKTGGLMGIRETEEESQIFSPVSEILLEEASSKAVRKAAIGAGKSIKNRPNQREKSSKQAYYSQVQWQATQFLLQRLTKEVAYLNAAFIGLCVLLPPSRWENKRRKSKHNENPRTHRSSIDEPLLPNPHHDPSV